MPKIDIDKISVETGSGYQGSLAAKMDGRSQFGVNIVTQSTGALSSLRHWHEEQDEFSIILDGTLTLIEDDGETLLKAGDCVAFPAGVKNENFHFTCKNGSDIGF
ncbi:MAG: cupin domain-containing protein [Paracoccaceae bacterium]